jgi:uncharacterized membrane protein YagU involved in acid resistance
MSGIVQAVLLGGALCGILDAIAASTSAAMLGTSPVRLWKYVASGLLGQNALQCSSRIALVGLLLHFLIAFIWATIFCLAALFVLWMLRWPAGAGIIYGIAIYTIMNLVVLPLSAAPKRQVTKRASLSN